jgi:hypothetical protein
MPMSGRGRSVLAPVLGRVLRAVSLVSLVSVVPASVSVSASCVLRLASVGIVGVGVGGWTSLSALWCWVLYRSSASATLSLAHCLALSPISRTGYSWPPGG